jgi:5-methylcytosine-specific restriction endonuclease McrA
MVSDDEARIDRLVRRVLSLASAGEIPYDFEEIRRLVLRDPQVFRAFLRRVGATRYWLGREANSAERVWMACNLARGYEVTPLCYFCATPLSRLDVLEGKAHIEHFQPRSQSGEHTMANLTLACSGCNLLKSDLAPEDFAAMLADPDGFFTALPRFRKRREQLLAFAEIALPHTEGAAWFMSRHSLTSTAFRQKWEALRAAYRQRWNA